MFIFKFTTNIVSISKKSLNLLQISKQGD